MSSSYPAGLDSLDITLVDGDDAGDATPGSTNVGPHAQLHIDANDAINKIEAELGINPSGSDATVKARLDALDTTVAGKAAGNDSRLSDTRTPTDGSVTDAKVASGAAIAQSKISGLTSALAAKQDTLTVQDEGSSLTNRAMLNFTGAGVTATDAGGKTVVTIPGTGAGTAVQSPAYTASLAVDASLGDTIKVGALTGNITIGAPTNGVAGQSLRFIFTQDATGGRSVTWNAVFDAPAWTPNLGPSQVTVIEFVYDGTTWRQLAATALVKEWFIDVTRFGAVADWNGSTGTDNGPAIQRAIDSFWPNTSGHGSTWKKGVVFFPTGDKSYLVNTMVSVNGGGASSTPALTFLSYGAEIYTTTASDSPVWDLVNSATSTTDTSFEGFKFFVNCERVSHSLAGQENARFTHCRWSGNQGTAVHFPASSTTSVGTLFDQCFFDNLTRAFLLQGGDYTSITNCQFQEGVFLNWIEIPWSNGAAITLTASSTDLFTTTDGSRHGYTNGMTVRLASIAGGSSLSTSTTYYVTQVTPTTFKLAATRGGSAVAHGATGSYTVGGYGAASYLTLEGNHIYGQMQTTGVSATGVASTDVFTSTSHRMLDGQLVYLSSLSGGSGLSTSTAYYVISRTNDTFQLSTSVGGAAVNFTTDVTAVTVTPTPGWSSGLPTVNLSNGVGHKVIGNDFTWCSEIALKIWKVSYVDNVTVQGNIFKENYKNDIDYCGALGCNINGNTFGRRLYLKWRTTVTMTIASPGVFTVANSGYAPRNGEPVRFSTSGALPTGITAGTTYYAVNSGVDGIGKFRIAATVGGADINTSGSQSGTHKLLSGYSPITSSSYGGSSSAGNGTTIGPNSFSDVIQDGLSATPYTIDLLAQMTKMYVAGNAGMYGVSIPGADNVCRDNGPPPTTIAPGDASYGGAGGMTDHQGRGYTLVRYTGALTSDRTVTFTGSGSHTGDRVRVVHAGTTFNVLLGVAGSLKTLAPSQWAEVEYTGSTFVLSAYGSL